MTEPTVSWHKKRIRCRHICLILHCAIDNVDCCRMPLVYRCASTVQTATSRIPIIIASSRILRHRPLTSLSRPDGPMVTTLFPAALRFVSHFSHLYRHSTLVCRPFSRTTRISWYRNVFILDFIGAADDGFEHYLHY